MDFIDEEWRPIHTLTGHECCIEYYVNREGEVKSTKRAIDITLKQRTNKNGYKQVNLTQRIGKKKVITVLVHRLVALAFLGPPPSMPGRSKTSSRILHIDGDKTNNSVDNLKWTKIEES
tara:strand:+ start:355 stop:711 length:357 start_codon:yes stop_codon:yes gene_type:complete